VLIMQRLHVDDLVGHVLQNGEGWIHLNLPAIADVPHEVPLDGTTVYPRAAGEVLHPQRESLEVLNRLKTAMGSHGFSAQYQQAPVPPGGALIKETWFRRYARIPEPRPGDQIVQSWDTASKANKTNNFSVCTTWLMRDADYYLLDVLRQRLEYPDLRRRIVAHAEAWAATAVLIEDASSGAPLIQDLTHEGKLRPISIRPDGDKIVRLEAQSPVIEAGHVLLPETASWLDDFLLEILPFPYGRYDDQVDSLSQFLTWASSERQYRLIPIELPVLAKETDPEWNY
jgi:predicted phage terminase large subunit-like protein